MAREINLTSNEWCNIIFEGKNHEYGAYALRKESSKRHYTAFAMVAFFALVSFSFPIFTKALGINDSKDEKNGIIAFINPDLETPQIPDEKIQKIETPVPEIKIRESIRFTIPKIEEDANVKEKDEMISQETLSTSTALIASATVESGNETGVSIDDLEKNTVLIQDDTPEKPFDIVEIPPTFPGGETELRQFLNKTIDYPIIAQENGIQGKVTVQFVVGKDGSIEDVQIARGVDRSLDVEAMRVIKAMPKWIPGKQGGRAVKVKFYVPVVFKLQ